jgi:hypothetical protein
MKTLTAFYLCLSLGSTVLLSQCSSTSRARNLSGPRVALPAGPGTMTTQRIGDTTVQTQTLIHHQLTNADSGKTYQVITITSPRGTSRQERVIVQASPYFETTNVTKKVR